MGVHFFPVRRWGFTAVFLLLFLLMVIILLIATQIFKEDEPVMMSLPLKGYTVVIDPGHGGYDPGVSVNGLHEKDIVLDISFYLRDFLKVSGANVVMTRTGDYDFLAEASTKKKRDLNNRLKIINESGGDLLLSIHVNSIASEIWSGAQTFYSPHNNFDESKRLAFLIQEEFINTLQNTDRYAKMGNYYILQEAVIPAAILEVGFISNPRERELLKNPAYREKVALAITKGVYSYLAGEKANEPDFPVGSAETGSTDKGEN